MSLQQLESVRKIKQIRRDNWQYRHRIYQAGLLDIEAEMVLHNEKMLSEVKRRKQYEEIAYAELIKEGGSIGKLRQLSNELKSMLVNEQGIEEYLRGIAEVYKRNKQELRTIKNELLAMETKLQGFNEVYDMAMNLAMKAHHNQAQDDSDDLAIANCLRKL